MKVVFGVMEEFLAEIEHRPPRNNIVRVTLDLHPIMQGLLQRVILCSTFLNNAGHLVELVMHVGDLSSHGDSVSQMTKERAKTLKEDLQARIILLGLTAADGKYTHGEGVKS